MGLIPRSGRSSGGGHDNPLQYSCLEGPKDRGACLVGYSPLGRTESDMTEATEHTHTMKEAERVKATKQDAKRSKC